MWNSYALSEGEPAPDSLGYREAGKRPDTVAFHLEALARLRARRQAAARARAAAPPKPAGSAGRVNVPVSNATVPPRSAAARASPASSAFPTAQQPAQPRKQSKSMSSVPLMVGALLVGGYYLLAPPSVPAKRQAAQAGGVMRNWTPPANAATQSPSHAQPTALAQLASSPAQPVQRHSPAPARDAPPAAERPAASSAPPTSSSSSTPSTVQAAAPAGCGAAVDALGLCPAK